MTVPSTQTPAAPGTTLPAGLFSDRTLQLGTENAFKIGPYIKAVEDAGHKVIKCNLGEPDFPLPKHIADEVKRCIDADMTHYCDPQGILPLREAIAAHMTRTRRAAPRRSAPHAPARRHAARADCRTARSRCGTTGRRRSCSASTSTA